MSSERLEVGDMVEVIDTVQGWTPAVILGTYGDEAVYDVSARLQETVHLGDIAATLSVVCGGSRDSKVEMALPFYSSGGGLALSALAAYLTSVFKALFEAQPSARGDASPQHLGLVTARRAFDENGVSHDDELPISLFRAWYSNEGAARSTEVEASEEEMGTEEAAAAAELARQSFGTMYVEDAYERLSRRAVDGKISRAAFEAALGGRSSLAAATLFKAFDTDHDGGIDLAELAAGLSVWCRGSRHEKIRAAFRLFDANGDGRIDEGEMSRYFASVFRVALPDKQTSPEALGKATARHVFATADTNDDGVLSFDEFAKWYEANSSPVDALVANADVVRVLSAALRGRDPREVHAILMARARDNRLSRAAFCRAFEHLAASSDLDAVLSRAFDMFDADGDGTVDSSELAAGLAALCGGERDTKVRFCFDLFDADGDGYVGRDELRSCLAAVFRVVEANGAAPDDLAAATADTIFAKVDTDGDGRVSYDEFDAWLSRARDDDDDDDDDVDVDVDDDPTVVARVTPDDEPDPRPSRAAASKQPTAPSDLATARRLLGLAQLSVDELVDAFSEAAPSGSVTRRGFARICRRVARLSGDVPDLSATADLALKIYDAFDPDGADDVQLVDVVAGLVSLADAPAREKIAAAFELFSPDDPRLSKRDLELYLLDVYRLLYAASPCLEAAMDCGAGPRDLADATAALCLAEHQKRNGRQDDLRIDVDAFHAFIAKSMPAGPFLD
ncbi:hypothetical protein CTAYLR_005323 [Chrysophaeum taylorii]|uniref:EF-hand domain-containing protein n=1 Tax=Chrysophaeum taylorii TaxID=2483200 RepID=A0AAD7U7N1_9STRA|nr:hypothetical protein CTAYLR_005323 [Chrysophaeum taylorii]